MHSALRLFQPCLLLLLVSSAGAQSSKEPPVVGGQAPDFTLKTPAGKSVHLGALVEQGPAVVVLLRGWPGFQDSYDTQQVADLVRRTAEFRARNARVVLVYPGEADGLKAAADAFVAAKDLPGNFDLVLDADYVMTKAYNLRWEGGDETAYPSTFVLGAGRKVAFAKVSRVHGGRADASEILQALGVSATTLQP
ncbi:redoxin domain-containing protein [Paludisphaera rhizosphaerae]|uniref:redoxin domain-containing protein n=1 Tax=Paludisphaera rhizosphaerae TaxID=2711216 RepID=UPI0013EAD6CC|nr:redoxin domain-containing protein [Paludisphaera rhizosphaerae]